MPRKSLHKPNYIVIVAVLAACFVVGFLISKLYLGIKNFVTPANTQNQTKNIPLSAILLLTANKKTYTTNEKIKVTLGLDSGGQGVEAADFIITFDPALLKAEEVTTENYFRTYPIKTVANNFVKISGIAFFDGKSLVIPKGKGVVAEITFTPLTKTKSAKITVDRSKTIIASGGKNILNPAKIKDVTFSIK